MLVNIRKYSIYHTLYKIFKFIVTTDDWSSTVVEERLTVELSGTADLIFPVTMLMMLIYLAFYCNPKKLMFNVGLY